MLQKLFLSCKVVVLGAVSFLAAPAAPAADTPVVFVVRATAGEAKLGYTSGQAVEFRFTLNPDFIETSSTSFDGNFATWKSVNESETFVFSNFEGTGLDGSFNISGADRGSQLKISVNWAPLLSMTFGSEGSSGLQADGTAITAIAFQSSDGMDLYQKIPTSYVAPSAFLRDYFGTYPNGGGVMALWAGGAPMVFTITETAVVPEPGSAVLLTVGAAGAFWAARRRKS